MGAKKDKKKGKQQQEEAVPQETKEEAPEPEQSNPSAEDKPADKPEPAPQEPVVADEVQPKEAEDPKEDKVEAVRCDEVKVVEGSKVFETKVPKILSDLVNVSGFNEETVSELRTYLERAQKVNFLEKFEELSSRSTPKVKDVVVDETNFDVLIGKIADFQGTSLKKNLNEQWKRLEESESFKTYLATKPLPVPVEAPEVALLADSTAKCASLESALKSLQTLHKKTEAALAGLWEHKTDAVEGLLEARKQYLQDVQLLPEEVRAVFAEAEKIVQEGLGQELRTEHRQEVPLMKSLKNELKISKDKIEELEKAAIIKNDLDQKLSQAHEESLKQQANKITEQQDEMAKLEKKLDDEEKKSRVLEQELQDLKTKHQKCSELESSAQAVARSLTLQQEVENLQEANRILQAANDALNNTSTSLNAQITEERSARGQAETSLQELRSNLGSSEQRNRNLADQMLARDTEMNDLRAENARLQQAAAEARQALSDQRAAANQEVPRASTLSVSQPRSEFVEEDPDADLFADSHSEQVDQTDRNVRGAAVQQVVAEPRESPSEPLPMEGDVIDPTQARNDRRVGVTLFEEIPRVIDPNLKSVQDLLLPTNSQLPGLQQKPEVFEAEYRPLQQQSDSQTTPADVQTTINQSAVEGSGGIGGESGLETQPLTMKAQPAIKQQNQTQLQVEHLPPGPTTLELQKSLDELKQENQKLGEDLAAKNTTIQDLKIQIDNLKPQLDEAKKSVEVSKSNEFNSTQNLKKLETELGIKNAEINSLKGDITNLKAAHNLEIDNLQNSLREVQSQVAELSSEFKKKSEEIERLNRELDHERSRSSTLTDSQFSVELSQQHANETAEGNAGIFAEAGPQQSNFSVATKPQEVLAVSQVIDDPPVLEDGVADQSETQTEVRVGAGVDHSEGLVASSRQPTVDVEAIKRAHAEDVRQLEQARADLENLEQENQQRNEKIAELETELSQKNDQIRTLEHDKIHLEKERDTFQKGQEDQLRVVHEKDEGLKKIGEELKRELLIKAKIEKEKNAINEAYEKFKVKYDELKKKYSHTSSGTSTPAKTLSGGEFRSSRPSLDTRIEEAIEAEVDVSEQTKQNLNQAAEPNVLQPESSPALAPFYADKSLVEALLSHLQKLVKAVAISKTDAAAALPVTAGERITLDELMLKISQHWQLQNAQTPQETADATPETESVQTETPQTLSHLFDTLKEENEMLQEQKKSLSISLETCLNLLKELIPKVLGAPGLKPLEECCAISQITEEIAKIIHGDFSTRLDEIIAAASSVASLKSKIAQCEKEFSDLKTRNQQLQGPAERFSQVEKLLTTPRNTFREQNPVNILEQVAAATETSPVNVEVWRKGLATCVAHVIKDLLRRILSVVPQLHTVNPKRNAPWINHLLDVMSGVSSGTDALLSQLSSAEDSQSFEEFVRQLQKIVCTALEGHN